MPISMRPLLLLSLLAIGLFPASLVASDQSTQITLRYRSVADAAQEVSRRLGAEGTAAIFHTDIKSNAITLRSDAPVAPKVRALLAAFDQKQPQVIVRMKLFRQGNAEPGKATPQEKELADPMFVGSLGKPMIVSFKQDGQTYRVELNAEVQKP